MSSRLIFVALMSILLGGCAALVSGPPTADYRWFALREPAGFGPSMQLEQRFRYQDKKSQLELTLVQSVTPGGYALVAFAAVGGAVFSAQWSQAGVTETRSPLIPRTLKAQTLLSEMQLALWSIMEVRKGIVDPNFSVAQSGLERTLFYRDKPMIQIKYSQIPSYGGVVEFVNLETGHRWQLETLSFQPLAVCSLREPGYA